MAEQTQQLKIGQAVYTLRRQFAAAPLSELLAEQILRQNLPGQKFDGAASARYNDTVGRFEQGGDYV